MSDIPEELQNETAPGLPEVTIESNKPTAQVIEEVQRLVIRCVSAWLGLGSESNIETNGAEDENALPKEDDDLVVYYGSHDAIYRDRTLRLLQIALECMRTGTIVLVRAIYYENRDKFPSPLSVTSILDIICNQLQVTRLELFIVAANEGFVFGSGVSFMRDGDIRAQTYDTHHVNLPSDYDDIIVADDIACVVVVEKQTVFQALIQLMAYISNGIGRILLVTGRGYPDEATRSFMNKLHQKLDDRVPILGIFDPNPHGIRMSLVYWLNDVREALSLREDLDCPRFQCVGLFPSYFLKKNYDLPLQSLLPRETTMAQNTLQRPSLPSRMKRALRWMLDHDAKADLEQLIPFGGYTGGAEHAYVHLVRSSILAALA